MLNEGTKPVLWTYRPFLSFGGGGGIVWSGEKHTFPRSLTYIIPLLRVSSSQIVTVMCTDYSCGWKPNYIYHTILQITRFPTVDPLSLGNPQTFLMLIRIAIGNKSIIVTVISLILIEECWTETVLWEFREEG